MFLDEIPRLGEQPRHAITTVGLTKRFGSRTVVDDVTLDVPWGSVSGLVGPTGAGKTTTIRMLLGLVRPSGGSGTILGGNLDDPTTYLQKVGALVDSPAFYPQLSGRENLGALAALGRLPSSRVASVLDRVGLARCANFRYRTYPLDVRLRLGVAAALLADPELVILDGPTNGLDPPGLVEMHRLIRSISADGITVLISSRSFSEIEQICDYAVAMRRGQIVHQGRVAEHRSSNDHDTIVASGARRASSRSIRQRMLRTAAIPLILRGRGSPNSGSRLRIDHWHQRPPWTSR
jgi:ABC-2 type transport system ATP-binding protein